MQYNITHNNITFANGYSLDFEHPVKQTLQIEDVLVIIVEAPLDEIYRDNVFAITPLGDFLWRIEDTELFYNGRNCWYVAMEMNDQNELVLFNWCDTAIVVDYLTGAIIRKWVTK